MLGAAFAAGLLLSLGQLQWDASLRAEGRALQDSASDLQLEPHLGVESLSRDVALSARYDPQVIFRTPAARGTFDALQRETLAAGLRLDPDTSVVMAQNGSVGTMDLSWLALPASAVPPINVQGSSASSVAVLNESAAITLGERISSRLSTSATGGFFVTGALYDRDLAAYPRTSALRLALASSWTEHRDQLTVSGDGSYGWVSSGYTTSVVTGTAAWRHALSAASLSGLRGSVTDRRDPALGPLYETELRAGLALLGGTDPSQRHAVVPTATLALVREAPPGPGALGARISLRYAPDIDPTTGTYEQRGELSASIEVRIDRDLLAFAQGGLGYTPDPLPTYPRTLAQGEIGLTYALTRDVSVSAGTRVAHLPATEWAGVVSTTFLQHGRF